jgi:hypothetical protein
LILPGRFVWKQKIPASLSDHIIKAPLACRLRKKRHGERASVRVEKLPQMFARRINTTLLCLFIAFAVAACQKSQPPAAANVSTDSRPPQTATAPTEQQPQRREATGVEPPASATELHEVVKRIYQDAVIIDAGRSDAFVVGDFNGDNSQDIVVRVKPNKGKLAQLNSEYANWILEDPHGVMIMDTHKDVQRFPEKPAPVAVRQNDGLLAVIHGHQETGWRNPKATQTYLLKNVVGDQMEAQRARALLNATEDGKQLPPLRGDVIRETLDGTPGFIYWTGAKYAWHSVTEQQPR